MHPETILVQRVLADLEDYAAARRHDVAQGRETPELAGLLVQKYGYGLVKATTLALEALDGVQAAAGMMAAVDAAVASIDPHWQTTQARRWAARPARLVSD